MRNDGSKCKCQMLDAYSIN